MSRSTSTSATKEAGAQAAVARLDLVRNRNQTRADRRLLREMPAVHRLAHRYAYLLEVPEDELIAIGSVGLVKAADDYDEQHDGEFADFAEDLIVAEIERYVRSTRKQPESLRRLLGWDRETSRARQTIGAAIARQKNVRDLAGQLGFGVDVVADGLLAAVERDGTLATHRALRGAA